MHVCVCVHIHCMHIYAWMQKIKGGYEFERVWRHGEEMVRWECLKNRFLGDENLLCL